MNLIVMDISFYVRLAELDKAEDPVEFLRSEAKKMISTASIDAKKNPIVVAVKSLEGDKIRFRFLIGRKDSIERKLTSLRVFFPYIDNSTYFGRTEDLLDG